MIKFDRSYLIFLFIIITSLHGLTSCASSGSRIKVRNSSDTFAMDYFRNNADTEPVWSSFPLIDIDGSDVAERMIKLINSSESYILINSFLFMNDKYGSPVLEALRKKYQEGIEVYVIADSSSYYMPGEAGFVFLKNSNIPFVEYNPIRISSLFGGKNVLYRDHRKFWVIDGKYLYIGGSNVMQTSLKPLSAGGNADAMVLVESPQAASIMIRSFIDTWNIYSGNKLEIEMFQVPETKNYDTRVLLFNQKTGSAGSYGNSGAITAMLSGLFSAARREIWIIQSYTFVNKDILTAVRELSEKGVKVNVVISRHSNHRKFHYASYYGIKDLIDAGADVWIYSHHSAPLHMKAFIIDDRWVSIGSANFNRRSFRYSNEANIVFYDPWSVEILNRGLRKVLQYCVRVAPEEAAYYRTYPYRRWHRIMQVAG